ncbi:MAG: sulfur carrier protein ThiS [Paludibacteraceae bacterium]|nr:sulfur carrier protein ThiS [Paludibacteraceae bacterium]
MKIIINSKETETASQNLSELATELNLPAKGVAVAINNQMITRAEWPSTSLKENDNIVVVKAACGG